MAKDKKWKPTSVVARKRRLLGLIEKAQTEIRELRMRCSHVGSIEYCPDPSGNNDSSYDCTACGSSWRRWPDDVPR